MKNKQLFLTSLGPPLPNCSPICPADCLIAAAAAADDDHVEAAGWGLRLHGLYEDEGRIGRSF